MSLTNSSQVLSRNLSLLQATTPLFVNAPDDSFFDEYLATYPAASVACLNFHFGEHLALTQRYANRIQCHFSADYRSEQQHDVVLIHFPKSKEELALTLTMIAGSLADDAIVYLVGDNKGGVKSCPKLAANFLHNIIKIDNARHCLLFSGQFNNQRPAFDLQQQFQYYPLTLNGIELTIAALPGVFSQKKLDVGTAVLLKQLPDDLSGNTLDFGCGAGVISAFIGKKCPDTKLTLLDVNVLALASSRQTLAINELSGQVVASDGLSELNGNFQNVVTNPPFHQGVKTHYAATERFFKTVKRHLLPKARVYVVANSFLRYQPIMAEHIGTVRVMDNSQGFTLYCCQS